MSTDSSTDFQDRYLRTWTEPDPETRRANIDRIWTTSGRLVVSSLGITLEGREDIAAHISHVHDDLIAGKALRFAYDQALETGDALLLRWSMRAPSREVVARGADLVFRASDGRVETVYMFMGVD